MILNAFEKFVKFVNLFCGFYRGSTKVFSHILQSLEITNINLTDWKHVKDFL